MYFEENESNPTVTYFEMLPPELVYNIFQYLHVTEVMACQRLAVQADQAANYYYKRNFKTFALSKGGLMHLARDPANQNIEFAFKLLSCIGTFIEQLFCDFMSFDPLFVYPLSIIIQKNCPNLKCLKFVGVPNNKVQLPASVYLQILCVKDCHFVTPFKCVGNQLKTLDFENSENVIINQLPLFLREFPGIQNLRCQSNVLRESDCAAMKELQDLRKLYYRIVNPAKTSRHNRYNIKCLDDFVAQLVPLVRLEMIQFSFPFYNRLSEYAVANQLAALRRRGVRVFLIAEAFFEERTKNDGGPREFNYLDVNDVRALRSDLGGLSRIRACIPFNGSLKMRVMEKFVHLVFLDLTLTCEPNMYPANQFDELMVALGNGAKHRRCNLKVFEVSAKFTAPINVGNSITLVRFVNYAKQLSCLTIRYCTKEFAELMKTFKRKNLHASYNTC